MPLFAGKFTPKKSSPRKSNSSSTLYRELDANKLKTELGIDYGEIQLSLGEKTCVFDKDLAEWVWVDDGSPNSPQRKTKREVKLDKEEMDEVIKVKQRCQEVIEENRFLKVKIEILLDMVCLDFIILLLLIKTYSVVDSSFWREISPKPRGR